MKLFYEKTIIYSLTTIGFLTNTAELLFKTILEMQPRDDTEANAGGLSREDKVKGIIEDLLDKMPEEFSIPELMAKVA